MSARSLIRPASAAVLLTFALGLSACGEDGPEAEATDGAGSPSAPAETSADAGACSYLPDGTGGDVSPPVADPTTKGEVDVTVATSVGELSLELDAARTPCTVNSFVSLAEQGYFDGTTCHRLTTEGIYVLQCGDPTGTGAGGPGYSFADELDGTETYGAGTLAMANAGPNTNGSQFFIVYDDSPLPPSYTVFGQVDEASIETVTEVADAGSDEANGPGDGSPNTAVDIETVAVQ